MTQYKSCIASIICLAATTAWSQCPEPNTCRLEGDYAIVRGGEMHPVLSPREESSRPGLMRLIGSDFKNVFSRENLYILGIGAGASLTAAGDDDTLDRALGGNDDLEDVLGPGEITGGVFVHVGGALATYALGHLSDNSTLLELGQDLVRAQVLGQTLTQGMKLSTRRARPDGSNRFSLPSGHASGSFATATVLQRHFGWKAGVPAYALSSYVAVSRIQAQRHHLSDVVFGAAVGIVAGRTVTLGRGQRRIALQPFASRDGFGFDVVLQPRR